MHTSTPHWTRRSHDEKIGHWYAARFFELLYSADVRRTVMVFLGLVAPSSIDRKPDMCHMNTSKNLWGKQLWVLSCLFAQPSSYLLYEEPRGITSLGFGRIICELMSMRKHSIVGYLGPSVEQRLDRATPLYLHRLNSLPYSPSSRCLSASLMT